MKGMPLISVVIPVYNEESYVSDLIKSIKQQTYKNYEIIAADSSTDNNGRQQVNASSLDKIYCILPSV